MKLLLLAFIICGFATTTLHGQSRKAPVAPPLKDAENSSSAQKYFSDVVLVDQGKNV